MIVCNIIVDNNLTRRKLIISIILIERFKSNEKGFVKSSLFDPTYSAARID